jgi:hypothetical protein
MKYPGWRKRKDADELRRAVAYAAYLAVEEGKRSHGMMLPYRGY